MQTEMGGAGAECDSVCARARRTTMQSWRVKGGERGRFQYVGHCREHGSCIVLPMIVHVNITGPCCQTPLQRVHPSP